MGVVEEPMDVQEETIFLSITSSLNKSMGQFVFESNISVRLFLPAPAYVLLSPAYIFVFPKISLYNISDYIIWKSFLASRLCNLEVYFQMHVQIT